VQHASRPAGSFPAGDAQPGRVPPPTIKIVGYRCHAVEQDLRLRKRMRRSISQNERNSLAGAHLKVCDRRHALATGIDRCSQHGHVLATNCKDRTAVLRTPDPGNVGTKSKADYQFQRSLTRPLMQRTRRTISEALPRGGMKSICASVPSNRGRQVLPFGNRRSIRSLQSCNTTCNGTMLTFERI